MSWTRSRRQQNTNVRGALQTCLRHPRSRQQSFALHTLTGRKSNSYRLELTYNCGIEQAGFLERHVVRGFLEPNQPLDRRAQGCEISGCQSSIRVLIVSAEKEQDWHTGAGDRASQVQTEEFLIHRLKRHVVGVNEARDFPWRDEAAKDGSNHDPSPPWFLVKNAAIALDQLFHCQHLADGFVRWRADFPQVSQGSVIVAA